jgi:coenzyme F420 hydrogenase subunit beta
MRGPTVASVEDPSRPPRRLKVLVAGPDPVPLAQLVRSLGVEEVLTWAVRSTDPAEAADGVRALGANVVFYSARGGEAIVPGLRERLGLDGHGEVVLLTDLVSDETLERARRANVSHVLGLFPRREQLRETLRRVSADLGIAERPGALSRGETAAKPAGTEAADFGDLEREVVFTGLCSRCYACVSFCGAAGFGAIGVKDGLPAWSDPEECIKDSICYLVCPLTYDLEKETRERYRVESVLGPVLESGSFRAADPEIRARATDGGFVTGFLDFLLRREEIDAALLPKKTSALASRPIYAMNREDLLMAAGSSLSTATQVQELEEISTLPPLLPTMRGFRDTTMMRLAMVALPCQVHALRKMQTLGVTPGHAVTMVIGLFCTKALLVPPASREEFESVLGFPASEIAKANLRESFRFTLRDGDRVDLPLDALDRFVPEGCRKCTLYSSSDADFSVGGVGAPEGWTSVLARNARAARLLREAAEEGALERGPPLGLAAIVGAAERKESAGLVNGGRSLPYDKWRLAT